MRETKYKYDKADTSIFLNTDDEDLFPIEVKVVTPEEYETYIQSLVAEEKAVIS